MIMFNDIQVRTPLQRLHDYYSITLLSISQNANKTNATTSKTGNVLFKLQNKQRSFLFYSKRQSQQLETTWISISNSGKGRKKICIQW